MDEPRLYRPALIIVALFALIFPFVFSHYQVNIMTTALIYVMLGLGLNIEVGLAGLLDLGYVAFYAVGAYSYALLNYHFGLGFWMALPVGAMLGRFFRHSGRISGAASARRLSGHRYARLCGNHPPDSGKLECLFLRPQRHLQYSAPRLFRHESDAGTIRHLHVFFIDHALCLLTIFVIHRLQHSRIGRAWVALREDELACQAMGIDKTKAKLAAFALGATWAGMAGVLFAAKTTFINPASFTFLESAMILSIVVLGGMGSIVGVIIAALAMILIPEYLRVFSDYRMILFGAALIMMMIFRPQGILADRRKKYEFHKTKSSREN